jgi:mRNA-degrading endonuclease RelE of RelBE toxin-antitoxin system
MHPELKRRVRLALDALRENPASGKPLMRELAGWWSLRVGPLRIVYRLARGTIEIAVIGPRETIYLDAARRLSARRASRGR